MAELSLEEKDQPLTYVQPGSVSDIEEPSDEAMKDAKPQIAEAAPIEEVVRNDAPTEVKAEPSESKSVKKKETKQQVLMVVPK